MGYDPFPLIIDEWLLQKFFTKENINEQPLE